MQFVLRKLAHPAMRALQTQHQTALHLVPCPFQLLTVHTGRAESSDLPADQLNHPRGFPRTGGSVHRQRSTIGVRGEVGVDGVRQPTLFPDFLKQSGADVPTEHGVEGVGGISVFVPERDPFQAQAEVRLLERLLPDQQPSVHDRRPPTQTGLVAALERAEGGLQRRKQLLRVEIARDGHNGLEGMVVRMDVAQELFSREGLHRLPVPQDRTTERVSLQRLLRVQLLDQVLGIVLDHPDFLQHDLLLLVHLPAPEAGMMKQVREQRQRGPQVLIEHLDVEGRRLAGRKGVLLAAQGVNLPGNLGGRPGPRSLEDHMSKEVGQTGYSSAFIAGPDVHPDADGHRLQRRHPLDDHPHAIVQHELPVHDRPHPPGGYPVAGSFGEEAEGGAMASLRLRRILPCLSISSTLTITWSPSLTSSETDFTRWCASWEICTSPSVPGRISTKAPKSMIFRTVPR